jgi:hypothetical protein
MKIVFLPNTKPPPTFHKNFGRKLMQCLSTVSIVPETRSHAMRVQKSRHEIWVLHQKVGRCQGAAMHSGARTTDLRIHSASPTHPPNLSKLMIQKINARVMVKETFTGAANVLEYAPDIFQAIIST